MDNDLYVFLSTNKIFASVPRHILKRILPKFEKVELNQGEVLYYQGDPSDTIEILLSGKLIAILTTATGENKIIAEIFPGETVGEIGALSNQPRAVTVKSTKSSSIAKLPTDLFSQLCRDYPGILLEIINPLVSRSRQIMQIFTSERFKKNIAIIAANKNVQLTTFYEELNEHLMHLESIFLLSDMDKQFDGCGNEKIQKFIDEIKFKQTKKIKTHFLFLLSTPDSPLANFCFERLDVIYVIANGENLVNIDNFVLERINQYKTLSNEKPELILLHEPHIKQPNNTIQWLNLTEFGMHHHIRLNESKDFRRMIRFFRGKAIGLVLGGGGTRGWGHLGVIKALLDAGIPIDAVGGTSVGAIIAANYAMYQSLEEAEKQFSSIIEESRYSVSIRSLTWPAISLFNGKGLTHSLRNTFKDVQIEDLWLPYFCVSTNFATNSEVIHNRGMLWEKTRASASIPGIVPPMLLNGHLHFDGGLLNNLPVDIMRKITTHRGTIIAVELTANVKDEHKYRFPPVLTFWQTLLAKMGFFYDYRFPRFIDTFLKSLAVGSSLKAQQNSLAADLVISLDLSHYPMLYSNKKYEKKLAEVGYEMTMTQIKNMKKK